VQLDTKILSCICDVCGRAQKGGVDAKDLFHLYVVLWIQDKRLHLLDFCKFDKVTLMVLFLCLLSLVPTTLENYE
jgi:hypothetical protein